MPQALPWLAATVRAAGHEVKIVDCLPLRLGWRSLAVLLQRGGVFPVGVGVGVVSQQPLPISVDVAEVLNTMGCQLMGVVPTATDACSEANRMGMPMVSSDPQGTASGALIEIAERLETEQVLGK